MSRKTRPNRRGKKPIDSRRRLPAAVVFGMALAVVAIVAGGWWTRARLSAPPNAATAPVARVDFGMLRGRWQRSDGGYVIEITGVADSGVMEAAYFNPRPIHVANASASLTGGATQVFIELRDVDYPGSTYRLTYDPSDDRLNGIYFQAALQRTFDVSFSRVTPR